MFLFLLSLLTSPRLELGFVLWGGQSSRPASWRDAAHGAITIRVGRGRGSGARGEAEELHQLWAPPLQVPRR